MEISGIPILVFVAIGIAAVATLVMVRKLNELTKQLGVAGPSDPRGQELLSKALYGGETRLHDMGVHGIVWTIRGLFFLETLSILAVVYLMYSSGIA